MTQIDFLETSRGRVILTRGQMQMQSRLDMLCVHLCSMSLISIMCRVGNDRDSTEYDAIDVMSDLSSPPISCYKS